MSNKDQVKGAAKEVGGKIEKNVGRLIGNETLERKGAGRELGGKLQTQIGNMKEANRGGRKP